MGRGFATRRLITAGVLAAATLGASADPGTATAPRVTKVREVPLPAAPGTVRLPAAVVSAAGAAVTLDGKYRYGGTALR